MEPEEGSYDTSGHGRRRPSAYVQETPSEMLGTWASTVNEEIRHHAYVRPYVTVLAAAAAGYVLGAGVPRWVYRTAWDVGSKALLARMISSLVDPD